MTDTLTALLTSYDEGRLLWEAKGWAMEAVVDELMSNPELANAKLDLSQASLSRKTKSASPMPRQVAEAILRLETHPNREHLTEIVETGLRALHDQPTGRDPREVAQALLAHFPADELALKLADALLNQASLASGNGSLFDVFARAVADRLPRLPTLREAKVARHLARHLDRLSVKRLAVAGAAGAAVGCAVAILLGALSGLSRPTAPQVIVLANVGQGSTPIVFDLQTLLGAIISQMGKKEPRENWMPNGALPGQKPAQYCDASMGEKPINGGCWVWIADVTPPCGKLFRNGDKCYRPVAADPNTPIGGERAHFP